MPSINLAPRPAVDEGQIEDTLFPSSGPSIRAKATKYGYEGDPYGDSNSLSGIGHSDNQLEDGVSVALSQATARKLGLKPKQTADLLVTLENGRQIQARYDDTIPPGYGEDRIDFYTPSGRLDFDGQQVDVSVIGPVLNSIDDVRQMVGDMQDHESALDSSARVRSLARDTDGWHVDLEDGQRIEVDSLEAARVLREDLRQAVDESEAQAMIDLQDWLQSTGAGNESLAFTGELVTADSTGAVTFTREGEVSRIIDDQRTMATMRAELDALAVADAGEIGRDIVALVNGKNEVEMREGVAQLTSEVYQGGGGLAQIHETIEARYRALLANNIITENEALEFVRKIEETTGQKFLRVEPESNAIREAVSDIVVADVLARRKDSSLPGGAITKAVEGAIRGATTVSERRSLGKFRAFLRAARALFREVLKAAAAFKKAREEGRIEESEQAFIDELLGLDSQARHNQAVVNEAEQIYEAPEGQAFSVSSQDFLERTAERLSAINKPPAERVQAAERARQRVVDLANAIRREGAVLGISKKAIADQKRTKLAEERDKLEAEARRDFPILNDEESTKLRSNPLIQFLSSSESGPVRLNILSRGRAAKRPGFAGSHGDYDGAGVVPPTMLTGSDASTAPDIVAQEAFDSGLIASPTPDALWAGIEQALQEASSNKHALAEAKEALASARRRAQKAADAWEREQLEQLPRRQKKSAMQILENGIRALDAVLLGFPSEVRGKVGGFSKMAQLRTEKAIEDHLLDKVERADRELERYLVEQYRGDLQKLIDRATPVVKAGEKPTGNLGAEGHQFFERVALAVNLNETDVEAEKAKLASQQASLLEADGENTEALVDLFEQEQILDQFGGLMANERGGRPTRNAADIAAALELAQQVFDDHRNRWRMVEEARLKEVADLRSLIIEALGQPSVRKELAQIRRRDSKMKRLDDAALGFVSWVQTLEAALGADHPLVKRWNEAVAQAQAQKTDALIVMNERLHDQVQAIMGGASRLEALKKMWDMNHEATVNVTVKQGSNEDGSRAKESKRVPVDQALDLLSNPSADRLRALGLTRSDLAVLRQQFEASKTDREFFEIEGVFEAGTPQDVSFTEAEALTISMLAAQEEYASNMEKWGYDEEALAQIEEGLSSEAKALREWLWKEYAYGWEPMNRVFSRMYGVALPKLKQYSPGNFEHMGADRDLDAFGEGLMPNGGMRNGSLKTRKAHQAKPREISALAVYTGHVAQAEHFKAFAELTRELRGVFAHPTVKRAIKSARGEESAAKVLQWVEVMESNGVRPASGKDETSDKVKRLQGRLAITALAGKLGTLMVQSTAALASSARIGPAAYFGGLARLLTGQGHYREFLGSDLIQRRIKAGASPAQRVAMSRIMDKRPSVATQSAQRLMELIGEVDGLFTAVSGAVAYDVHLRQKLEQGMPEQLAKQEAMSEAEDIVRRTAQPVELTDRSLAELQPGPFAKFFLLFGSEARKNSAMLMEPVRRALASKSESKRAKAKAILASRDFWRSAFFVNVMAGGLAYLIRAAWWDMRDDSDDELFDDKHWQWWGLLRAMAFAPAEGFPLVRDIVSPFGGGGPADGIQRSAKQIKSLAKGAWKGDLGREPIEKIERTLVSAANATALASTSFVPVAVAANIFDQAFDVIDNIHQGEQD